ncbi:hypothetical protein HK414_23085 [Ramlibacter terrae]|uniref:Lipoprotein n=1 Tax=Ramlibacter terrae TaxID=2732511 RepID=A0ABX6P587_9BURK|nr:hypothetical protein HK414_23085 [Ramlibacter terrae]
MNKTSTRLARIIVALVVAVGLAACSAIKLGYNTFDDVAYWWLDGYIDFTDDQAPRARAELDRLHAWHRSGELPRFVEMLQRMERMAPGSVTPQQACGIAGEVQDRLKLVADQAEPAVLALVADLTPDQLRHLERKYRSTNDKFRKEWVHEPLAAQREKRYERMLDRLEMIYGRLDAQQRRVLRQGIEHSTGRAARDGRAAAAAAGPAADGGPHHRDTGREPRPAARLRRPGAALTRCGLPRLAGRTAAGKLPHLRGGARKHHAGAARAGGAAAAGLPAGFEGAGGEALTTLPWRARPAIHDRR